MYNKFRDLFKLRYFSIDESRRMIHPLSQRQLLDRILCISQSTDYTDRANDATRTHESLFPAPDGSGILFGVELYCLPFLWER